MYPAPANPATDDLWNAVGELNLQGVKDALAKGADTQDVRDGFRLLQKLAVRADSKDKFEVSTAIAKELLEHEANPMTFASPTSPATIYAAKAGNMQLTELLYNASLEFVMKETLKFSGLGRGAGTRAR